MAWLMTRADHRKVREIAGRQDESAGVVLFTLVVGVVLSLYAIGSELTRMEHVPADQAALRYAFTALTVIGSWLLVGVLFCFHYAHLYYRAPARSVRRCASPTKSSSQTTGTSCTSRSRSRWRSRPRT
jgi:uncharacterized membrane protein